MNTSLLILLLSVATLVSAGCSRDSDCPIGPCIFGRCPLSKHHDLIARPCDTKWDCSFFEVCVMGLCVGKSKHHEEENALALQTNSLKRCSSSADCPFNAPCIFGRCSISKKHDLMAKTCRECSPFQVCIAGKCVGGIPLHEEENALALQTNSLKRCSSSADCPFGAPCIFGTCSISKKHNLVPRSCDNKWDCNFFEVCVMGICVGKNKLHEEESALQTTNSLKACSSSSDCPFNAPCIFGRCSISKKHDLMPKGCGVDAGCSFFEICVKGVCIESKTKLHEEENALQTTNSLKGCSSSADCPFNVPCIFGRCALSKHHNLMAKGCDTKWDCSLLEVCVMGICVGKSKHHEEENAVALQTTNSLKECSRSSNCPSRAPCIFGKCIIKNEHNLMPKRCDNKWDCKFTEACVMGFCVGI